MAIGLALLLVSVAWGITVWISMRKQNHDHPLFRGLIVTIGLFLGGVITFYAASAFILGTFTAVLTLVPLILLGIGLFVLSGGSSENRSKISPIKS